MRQPFGRIWQELFWHAGPTSVFLARIVFLQRNFVAWGVNIFIMHECKHFWHCHVLWSLLALFGLPGSEFYRACTQCYPATTKLYKVLQNIVVISWQIFIVEAQVIVVL